MVYVCVCDVVVFVVCVRVVVVVAVVVVVVVDVDVVVVGGGVCVLCMYVVSCCSMFIVPTITSLRSVTATHLQHTNASHMSTHPTCNATRSPNSPTRQLVPNKYVQAHIQFNPHIIHMPNNQTISSPNMCVTSNTYSQTRANTANILHTTCDIPTFKECQ